MFLFKIRKKNLDVGDKFYSKSTIKKGENLKNVKKH